MVRCALLQTVWCTITHFVREYINLRFSAFSVLFLLSRAAHAKARPMQSAIALMQSWEATIPRSSYGIRVRRGGVKDVQYECSKCDGAIAWKF